MHFLKMVTALLAITITLTSTSWGQSSNDGAFRGNQPDGEVDRDVKIPENLAANPGMIPLLKLDPGTLRNLPLGDPAELEKSFGTVTRNSEGEISRSGPSADVLDSLRRAADDVKANSSATADEDPLFANDETSRAIVGADNRIRVRDNSSYPFRAFGLLRTENGSCSATVIGPYTVITAAHCVYSHENGWANETVFYPGANGQGNFPYRGYRYRETTILSGYINNYEGYYGSVVPWDLAVINTWEAVGDNVGWIGYSTNYGSDFRAYNVGYPGDKPYATMWRDRCNVSNIETDTPRFVHYCDTKPGSSGSSMYSYRKKGSKGLRYVEGINVGEVETGDRNANYNVSVRLTGAYFDWIKSLRY